MTACTQPGCTGRIVDCYCDVCGSPGDAEPFIPAAASASAVTGGGPGLMAVRRISESATRPQVAAQIAACAQPGCIGTIMDGYCDVCGSPASAAPESAASASPTLVDEPGITAVRTESGISPKPKNEEPNTACTGCNGTIIDGYCEVCGSPPSAGPLVPAAALMVSPAPADEAGSAAVPASTPASAPVNEENKNTDWIDIQESREVEATLRKLIKPAAADVEDADADAAESGSPIADIEEGGIAELDLEPAVPEQVDTEQVDTKHVDSEPVDVEQVDSEQVDTEQVDTAPASPHDDDTVEIPPLVAVPSGDGHPVPQLPELQESVQPTAAHIEKVETPIVDPAAADTRSAGAEEADTQKADIADVDVAAGDIERADAENAAIARVDTEKADTARVDTEKADTATAVPEPMAVLPAASAHVARPRPVRRGAVVAAGLLLLGCAVALYQIAPGFFTHGSRSSGTSSSAATTVATPGATTGAVSPSGGSSSASDPKNGSAQGGAIQLENVPESARTFKPVRIRGTYRAGAGTFLRVQRWEGGEWVAFPVPSKANESGKFTAYVEFWQPGRYEVRVLHPGSGVTSKTFVLVIKG
jgi:hypothetical protein